MKVYVLNDTSRQHAGCKATMKAFYTLLDGHEVIFTHYVGTKDTDQDKLIEADLVICNGEGTMHSNCRQLNFMLGVLRAAQDLGKKTALVNSVWQSNPAHYDVLSKLDLLTFREVLSQQEANIPNSKVYADLCFNNPYASWASNKDKEVLKGEVFSGIKWRHALDNFNYDTVLLDRPFSELLERLRNCKLYITGQYHGVVLATIARVPFVAVQANTHKIQGFLKTAGVAIPVCQEEQEIQHEINTYQDKIHLYKQLFDYYDRSPRLTKEVLMKALTITAEQ